MRAIVVRGWIKESSLAFWTADGGGRYAQVLSAWQCTPAIVLGLLLLAVLYANGMRRRCGTAGLPRSVRRAALGPLLRSRTMQAGFAFLAHPVSATILGGGVLYFWMIPDMYDRALLNERIHDLMHFSMLFGGLLFWWRVLDIRRPPIGASYLCRAAMLEVNLMMVAFLGVFLTAKQAALYGAIQGLDLWHLTAIADERIGGCVLWFGGCAILVERLRSLSVDG